MLKRLTILVSIALLLAAPARAVEGVAPFDNDLARLSEILGALHYLRAICNSKEGQKWRLRLRLARRNAVKKPSLAAIERPAHICARQC